MTYPAHFDGVDTWAKLLARAKHEDPQGERHFDPSADPDVNNNLRAAWAALGLEAYVKRTFGAAEGEDFETLIGDLFSDLMHLCNAVGLIPEDIVAKAAHAYDEELHGVL